MTHQTNFCGQCHKELDAGLARFSRSPSRVLSAGTDFSLRATGFPKNQAGPVLCSRWLEINHIQGSRKLDPGITTKSTTNQRIPSPTTPSQLTWDREIPLLRSFLTRAGSQKIKSSPSKRRGQTPAQEVPRKLYPTNKPAPTLHGVRTQGLDFSQILQLPTFQPPTC